MSERNVDSLDNGGVGQGGRMVEISDRGRVRWKKSV